MQLNLRASLATVALCTIGQLAYAQSRSENSNISTQCPGEVTESWEQPGGLRKFPTGGSRSNWMGDFHKNPCAVYYLIQEGVMQFSKDMGVGMYGWQEGTQPRTDWPVTIDAVGSALAKPSKWTYILCREWHPAMKEWRCR